MENPKELRVAITGASGFVSKNVRSLLYKNGVNISSISRKNFSNYPSESKIITPEFSIDLISKKLKNCNALVHLVGIGRQSTNSTFDKINVGITQKVVQLCKKLKIKKVVYLSGLGVSKKSVSAYFISKYNAEQEIINSGLDYTIFRPSYIIGNDDPLTRNIKKQIKRGKIIIPGTGNYHLQPISVNDVAKVIYYSINSNKFSKKIIDLVGPETITFNEYVKIFKGKTSTKIENQDLQKSYYNAIHNLRSNYGIDDLNIMIGDFIGNHNRIKKLFGFEFKNFRDIL